MSSTSPSPQPLPYEGDHAWELAAVDSRHEDLSEEAYLQLTDHANERVEYADGRLEFLPMPTEIHEALVRFLFLALYTFVGVRREK